MGLINHEHEITISIFNQPDERVSHIVDQLLDALDKNGVRHNGASITRMEKT